MFNKLMNIDRRVIFILVALVVIIPTLIPIRLPTRGVRTNTETL